MLQSSFALWINIKGKTCGVCQADELAQDLANLNRIVGYFLLQPVEVRQPTIITPEPRTDSAIVGDIDEAFSSRIHFNLHIPPLTSAGRHQLWNKLFVTFQNQNYDVWIDEEAIEYARSSPEIEELLLDAQQLRNGIYSNVNRRVCFKR